MSVTTRKYMSKRQRPCDFCRSRKTACRIESGPPCRTCTLHGRECTFVEAAPARRKPMQPGVVTASASGLANMPGTVDRLGATASGLAAPMGPPDADPGPSAPPNAGSSASLRLLDTPPLQSPSRDPLVAGFDSVGESFFSGLDSQWFQNLGNYVQSDEFRYRFQTTPSNRTASPSLSLIRLDVQGQATHQLKDPAQVLLDTDDDVNPQILGWSGEMDPYMMQIYHFDRLGNYRFNALTVKSVSQGPAPVQFLLSQPSIFSATREEASHVRIGPDVLREELETIVSAATGKRLIALYRKFVAPQCPMFANATFPDPKASPPYLLAAVYAIIQPFFKFDERLCIELAYEPPDTTALSRIIYKTLYSEAHSPSLASAQTLLLLVLRPSTNQSVSDGPMKWSLLGSLVACAQTLGLHLDPKQWDIAPWQIAQRRRTAFLIYAVDKWLACTLGRPPLLYPDSWLVTSLEPGDDLESGLSSQEWQEQLHYSKLSNILSDVLFKLYSLRAVNELASDYQKTQDIAQPFLEKLSTWNEEFSSPRHSDSQDKQESLPSVYNVCKLGYHYVQLTIFRAILRPFLARSKDDEEMLTAEKAEAGRLARLDTRSSTSSAVGFVKDLQQEQFNLFWPQWSQIGFSSIGFMMLLMATTAADTEETKAWLADLQAARKEFRTKSSMLPALHLGLLRIDSIFWRGVHNVMKLQPHVEEVFKAAHRDLDL